MEHQQIPDCSMEDVVPTNERVPPSEMREEPRLSSSSNSEPFVDHESDEDFELGSSRHTKKTGRETQPNEEPRVETEQTQKLRRATVEENSDAGHGSDEDSCMQDEDVDDAGPPVLERVVSEEHAAADLEEIRGMWELAAVYEFMVQFKYWLNFSQLYPVQDLEEAIVKSPGPGLLAQLHVDLLHGIATRSQVGQDNWASTLAARLISEANAMQQPLSSLPFKPVRGKEAAGYAALSARNRVLTLKALADMRADREDMRTLVDDIMRAQPGSNEPGGKRGASGTNTPPRRSGRGSSAPPPPPALSAEDMRGREALGCDAAGCRYYWFDMPYDHDAPVGLMGSRLYVEGAPRQPRPEELQQQQQQQVLQKLSSNMQLGGDGDHGDTSAAEAACTASKPPLPSLRVMAEGHVPQPASDTQEQGIGSTNGSPKSAGIKQQAVQQHAPELQQQSDQLAYVAEHSEQPVVKQEASEQQQQLQEHATTGSQAKEDEEAAAAFKCHIDQSGEAAAIAHGSQAANSQPGGCTAEAPGAADAQPDSSAAGGASAAPSKGTGRGKKRPSRDVAAVEQAEAAETGDTCDAAAAQIGSRKRQSRASSERAEVTTAVAAAGLLQARPGRKAAAEAAAKVAQQLGKKAAAALQNSEVAAPSSPAASKKPPRAGKGRESSKASSAVASEDADNNASLSQPNTDASDAALAASLGRMRPTRRAAADASAKIAAQAQNPPIYKLVEDAAVAAAAVTRGAGGSNKPGKACKAASAAGADRAWQPVGADYVLPADEVAGSWRLAADSVEGLEALAHELFGRDDDVDVALGRLLLEQVVATLLERKEREEKYARARSRVAKSLGLDAPAAELGRPQRQRRKPTTYNFEDYDRSMRRAILASARGEFEEFPAQGREPYKAPPYDFEVRRGRSGGAAEPVPTLEEIEAMRKRRIELAKLGLLDTGDVPHQLEEQEQVQQQQEQGQGQAVDGYAIDKVQRQQQQQEPSFQVNLQQAAADDRAAGVASLVQSDRPLQDHAAAAAAPTPTAKQLLESAGGVPQPRQRKQAASNHAGSVVPKPRKPAAPKPRPAQPPPPPSAWQITAAAAASAAAAANETGANGGRPRRRAAAGVAAAVAAAAAAAGGREEDFLGMASHMQSEWEAHHSAGHIEEPGVLQGWDATPLDRGDGLLQRGHFHSSSTQPINHMAEPHSINQEQLQQPLQLQGQAARSATGSWCAAEQQNSQQQAVHAAPLLATADAGGAWQSGSASEPALHVPAAPAAVGTSAGAPGLLAAGEPVVAAGPLPLPADATSVQAALAQLQAMAAEGTTATAEPAVPPPRANTGANGTAGYPPATADALNITLSQQMSDMHQHLPMPPHGTQWPARQLMLQQQPMAGTILPAAPKWGTEFTQQQQPQHQYEQQLPAQQQALVGFAGVLPGISTAAGMGQLQQPSILPSFPIPAATPQSDQQLH